MQANWIGPPVVGGCLQVMHTKSGPQLYARLLAEQLVQPAQIPLLLKAAQRNKYFLDSLFSELYCEPTSFAKTCAHFFNIPLCTVEKISLPLLPSQMGFENTLRGLFWKSAENTYFFGFSDPTLLSELCVFSFHLQALIVPVVLPHTELLLCLSEMQQLQCSFTPLESEAHPLLEHLLQQASIEQASDIHLEPTEHALQVRSRIDGLLQLKFSLSKTQHEMLINHIKILAHLDITEQRLPQDGQFKYSSPLGLERDCRVSICPTQYGEKIVIRLLNAKYRLCSFQELGMSAAQQACLQQALTRSQGLLLITGPTGSGKTITLYNVLHQLNRLQLNICTIEDPIEIRLPGIQQVNINPKIGLDFLAALRAFLRQDPDVLMVGEIRDPETAQMAVQAAQTGHLVLSTLHTNGAAETRLRLQDLGIKPYQIEKFELIIAQRLLRKLCKHCKRRVTPDFHQIKKYGILYSASLEYTFFEPQGCEHCSEGFRGRFAIFEFIYKTKPVGTLKESALLAVKNGLTSWSEITPFL